MWVYLASYFKDHNALLGYDVLNEPFPGENAMETFGSILAAYCKITKNQMSLEELVHAFGNPETKIELLSHVDDSELYAAMAQVAEPLIHQFDQGHLKNFYCKLFRAIRSVDPDHILMLENSYFSNMGVESGIEVVRDSENLPLSNLAFTPHGYDLLVDTPQMAFASNNRIQAIFESHRRTQGRISLPVLVGEWGACDCLEGCQQHSRFQLDLFDTYKWSNTYWCYRDGIEKQAASNTLNRPYPQAVVGDLLVFKIDHDSRILNMEWIINDHLITQLDRSPTSIYLPTNNFKILNVRNIDINHIKTKEWGHLGCLLEIQHDTVGATTISINF